MGIKFLHCPKVGGGERNKDVETDKGTENRYFISWREENIDFLAYKEIGGVSKNKIMM